MVLPGIFERAETELFKIMTFSVVTCCFVCCFFLSAVHVNNVQKFQYSQKRTFSQVTCDIKLLRNGEDIQDIFNVLSRPFGLHFHLFIFLLITACIIRKYCYGERTSLQWFRWVTTANVKIKWMPEPNNPQKSIIELKYDDHCYVFFIISGWIVVGDLCILCDDLFLPSEYHSSVTKRYKVCIITLHSQLFFFACA